VWLGNNLAERDVEVLDNELNINQQHNRGKPDPGLHPQQRGERVAV